MKNIESNNQSPSGIDFLGLFYAIAAAVLFSFKPILVKLIYEYDVPTMTVLAWRSLLAAPVYLLVGVILWLRHDDGLTNLFTTPKLWAATMLLGVVSYYGAAYLDLYGLQYISAQLERLILFTYPTIVAVLAWLIYKRNLTFNSVAALLISYVGIAVLFISDWQSAGDNIALGSFAVFLAAIAFALTFCWGRILSMLLEPSHLPC